MNISCTGFVPPRRYGVPPKRASLPKMLHRSSWAVLFENHAAEGGYSAMALMNSEREKIIIQARSLSDEMNDPVIIEGVLPAAANEAAVEEKFAKEHEIKLGDKITLEHD